MLRLSVSVSDQGGRPGCPSAALPSEPRARVLQSGRSTKTRTIGMGAKIDCRSAGRPLLALRQRDSALVPVDCSAVSPAMRLLASISRVANAWGLSRDCRD